jgi:hypothetical protein
MKVRRVLTLDPAHHRRALLRGEDVGHAGP